MEETTYIVEYDSNNSGGSWWLSDEDWKALEDAGWTVMWGAKDFCNDKFRMSFEKKTAPDTCPENKCHGHRRAESYAEMVAKGDDFRYMGALAREATIEVVAYSETLAEGVAETWWEEALPGEDAKAEGCNCCGRPHNFYAAKKDDR